MCGIVGIVSTSQIAKALLESLKQLSYRGYDSAGMATATGGGFVLFWRKGVGTVEAVERDLKLSEMPGTVGIAQTRWATHGGVTGANAHPHLDCGNRIAVVHNGIISGHADIRRRLESEGHRFLSETDTEVIPHLLEGATGPLVERALKVSKLLEGSFAFLALDAKGGLVGTRRGCPLVVGIKTGQATFVASDLSCLPEGCQIYALEDDEVCSLQPEGVSFFNSEGKAVDKKPLGPVPGFVGVDSLGYPHFMEKEIREQAALCERDYPEQLFSRAALGILRAHQVIFTASGSSYHAALLGRYYFSKVARKPAEVVVASDFIHLVDSITPDTVVLAISQSGETADVLDGVKRAKEAGASVVSLVNRPHSLLERLSDIVLALGCGPEYGVAATKSFGGQIGLLYVLSHAMAGTLDLGVSRLRVAQGQIGETIKATQDVLWELGWRLLRHRSIYCLGRGVNVAVAQEGALKLKEIAYIHAEGMPAGEMKHGSLALIEKGTVCLFICPSGATFADTIANAHEVKARGGTVIAISDQEAPVYDYWLKVPTMDDGLLYPLVTVIPFQLLSFYLALTLGYSPDRPRNLAKSVTVK